jgi:hypothetical protein
MDPGPAEERICLRTRPHAIVLVRPLAQAVALAAVGAFLVTRAWPFAGLGAVLAVAGALIALRAVWRWERTRIVVTTERLALVEGTLRRRATSARGALEVEQSVLGRLAGYGTLVAGDLRVDCVPEANRLARAIERIAS